MCEFYNRGNGAAATGSSYKYNLLIMILKKYKLTGEKVKNNIKKHIKIYSFRNECNILKRCHIQNRVKGIKWYKKK